MLYVLCDNTVVELATISDSERELETIASETDIKTDDTLYLSESYYGKDLNDIYSMLVSCRNCIILLIFVVLVFEVHKTIKNAFKRYFKIKE